MPIKRAIAKTNFSIQPLPITSSQPSIGSLPALNKAVEEIPEVITQGDAYFTKESIGTAKYESRMMPDLSLDGTISSVSSSSFSILNNFGYSPERLSIISKIDFPKNLDDDEIEENLLVLDLEEKLLIEDYDFIKSYIQSNSSVSGSVLNLEGLATLDKNNCEDLISAIQNISFSSEVLSKNLDFIRYENSLQIKNKSKSIYSTFLNLFKLSFDNSFFESNVSTTFVVNSALNSLHSSKNEYYKEFENYVIKNGIVAGAFKKLRNNETITEESQMAIMCQFLSNIFSETFYSFQKPILKTDYNNCNIFESQNTMLYDDTVLYDENILDVNSFSRKFVKSHKDGIINPAISTLDTKKIEDFELLISNLVDFINDKKDSGQLDTNNGSGFDIFSLVLKNSIDCFSTSFTETGDLNPALNKNEIIDAILILFSLYKKSEDQETTLGFSNFLRGIILTSLLDDNFIFAKTDSGKFDTVAISKTEVSSDISGSQTYSVKSGTNILQNASLDQDGENYKSIYENEERKKNFTQEGLDYGEKVMRLLDLGLGTTTTLDKIFYGDYENTPRPDEAIKDTGPLPAIKIESISTFDNYLVSENYFVNRLKEFKNSTYGKTVISKIDEIYNSIVAIFEIISGKTADSVIIKDEFIFNGNKIHKRAIYDAIIECFAIVFNRIKIGYSSKTDFLVTQIIDGIETSSKSISNWFLTFDIKSFNHLSFLKKLETNRDLSNLSKIEYNNFDKKLLTEAAKFSYGFLVEARSSYSILKTAFDLIYQSLATFKTSIISCKAKTEEIGFIPEIFSNITPEISANLSFKFNNNFSIWSPSSLNKTNITVAKWFFKNLSQNGLLIIGVPSGFTDNCRRSTATINTSGIFTSENSEPKNILKFILDARLIENSFTSLLMDDVNSSLGRFHPLVDVKIIGDIPDAGILDISKSDSIEISYFDLSSGKWIVSTYEECLNFIASNDLNSNNASNDIDEYSDIITSHTLDAIIKNSITTLSGFDFTTNLIGQGLPSITSKKATDLLTIISSIDGDVIPRRGLTANNFLTANIDGTYSLVPFSKLDGMSSNLVTPSDYSLLLKFISSGIFTSEWMYKECINPGIFEKIYCIPVDLSGLNSSLLSIKVEMK